MMKLFRILILPFSFVTIEVVIGCGGVITPPSGNQGSCVQPSSSSSQVSCPARLSVPGVALTGKVLAGSQPVNGASVQLYAPGIAGNGSASAALLTNAVTTGANGIFTIPSGYSCPSTATPVYLLSKGGQPGSASNPSLWLMTALGPCGSISTGTSIVLNEVTTIAAVWALAPFMSAGGNVGASCTNTGGLTDAFVTANLLSNRASGTAPGSGIPSGLAPPTTKLNTLANALAACTTAGGTACSTLFNDAPAGSLIPGNTLDAALNIAHSPAADVSSIYSLAASSNVYAPALSAAPPDWILSSVISGGGMSLPASISISASGDIWVSSYFNAVSQFTPAGAAVFSAGISGDGINQSYGMALDLQGNVWIANEQTTPNSGSGNITELDPSGQNIESGLTGGGINFPIAVAADTNGNMWFANYGNSTVTLVSSSGTPLSPSAGWGANSLTYPVAVAVDSDHNAWIANQAGQLPITRISANGSKIDTFNCDCNGASGVATDESNNIWIANYYGNSVSEVDSCGKLVLDAVTGGGIEHPQGIAVDGSGNVWVANYLGNSVSEIAGSGSSTPGTLTSPSTGFGSDAALVHPYSLAVDASGAIWVSNFGNNTLTQFIGVAAPVKTPLAGPPQSP